MQIPVKYVRQLNRRLAGEPPLGLTDLFADNACVERYVFGEPTRIHCGLEQIEESCLRLPPIGGTFHVTDVRDDGSTVHARFFTRDFPYPMRGVYRFDLDDWGRIVRLYVSAKYTATAEPGLDLDLPALT
jgi:hypothetical protein